MKPVMIEFSDGKPFEVWIKDGDSYESYDVEYCKRDDELYADCSGGGDMYLEFGESKFWLGDGGPLPEHAKPENKIDLPDEYAGDWWEKVDHSFMYYCEKCDDRLPLEWPCDHSWDCDKCGAINWPSNECRHAPQTSGRQDNRQRRQETQCN